MAMPIQPSGRSARTPRKAKGTWRWILVGLAGISTLGTPIWATFPYPAFAHAGYFAMRNEAFKSARGLANATYMYAEANDDRFPFANNWETSIARYLQDRKAVTPKIAAKGRVTTRFALNRDLSGRAEAELELPSEVPLFFLSTLPGPSASGGMNQVAYVPTNRAIIAFADKSTKAMPEERLKSLYWTIKPIP